MSTFEQTPAPNPQESLADYVRRVRIGLGMSQKKLAERAGIHLQSVGKIERGQTTRLKQKPKSGLASALSIPLEYLDAVCKGIAVETITSFKICPYCWTSGTSPDPMWTNVRAKYCYVCGSELRDRCANCKEPILSFKFKFCPYCGQTYREGNLATR